MGVVQKYLGTTGVLIYLALTALIVAFGRRYVLTKKIEFSEHSYWWLTGATFLFLVIAYSVGYPLANSGILGAGSDRDEALNIATKQLLSGNYPYLKTTYLDNPISPMPGSLFLAVPFVLLGNSAYQNFFWLFIFLLALRAYTSSHSILIFITILALSPAVLRELVTGGDFLANSLYVALSALWFVTLIPGAKVTGPIKFSISIFLGLSLASRVHFMLILIPLFSAIGKMWRWRPAIFYTSLTCLIIGSLVAPYYLYNPQEFTPLTTTNKLSRFDEILPYAGKILPAIMACIAIILSICAHSYPLRNASIILSFPSVCAIVLQSVASERLDFSLAGYGMSFLFLGVMSSLVEFEYEEHNALRDR